MNHLKKFKKFESCTILDEDIKKYIPKSMEIVTSNGEFSLVRSDVTREIDIVRITYWHSTQRETGNVLSDGEPDYLEIDLHFVQEEKGSKILVDVSYGDFMASEFSIMKPNKISIIHYTGKGSKIDPKSHFGFTTKSLKSLITFFNRFGYNLSIDQFKFIDQSQNSYKPKTNIKIPTVKD